MKLTLYIRNFLFNVITFILNLVIHRKQDYWLFGSWMGEKFADNSRFLFQYLSENKEIYKVEKVIWVTRNTKVLNELKMQGYTAYHIKSVKGLYFHLKCGVHVICNVTESSNQFSGDILGRLSLGAKKIQLWHGIPLKGLGTTSNFMIERNNKFYVKIVKFILNKLSFVSNLFRYPGGWNKFYLYSPSNKVSKIFSDIFSIPMDQIIKGTYPRNCPVLKYTIDENKVRETLKKYSLKILYLPTFRETSTSFEHPLTNLQIKEILVSDEGVWIEKKHSASNAQDLSLSDRNVIKLDPNFDINTILTDVDLIITDYSSVCFDAVFMDTPVVHYVPDFETYKNLDRGFTLDFDTYTTKKIMTIDELKIFLSTFTKETFLNQHIEHYNKIKKELFDDGISTYENIMENIFLKLEE